MENEISERQTDKLRQEAENKLSVNHIDKIDISKLSRDEIEKIFYDLQVHQIELQMRNDELYITNQRLDRLKEQYSDLYDKTPLSYITISKNGLIIQANRKFASLIEVQQQLIQKKYLREFVTKETQDVLYLALLELFTNLQPKTFKLQMKSKSGVEFPVELDCTINALDNSQALVILKNITEQEQIEQSLKKDTNYLRTIIETVHEGITLSDISGHFQIFNTKMEDITGYTMLEANQFDFFLGKLYPLFGHHKKISFIINKLQTEGGINEEETQMTTKDGNIKTVLVSTSIIRRNNINYFLSAFRDITNRREAEKKIQEQNIEYAALNKEYKAQNAKLIQTNEKIEESENRFRDIVYSSNDWIWEINSKFEYTYVSDTIKPILGYEPEEIIGKTSFDLMLGGDVAKIKQIVNDIFNAKEKIVDLVNWIIHKNGKMVCLQTNAVPIIDNRGNLLGYRGVDKDITKQKEAEQTLKDSEVKLRELNATKDKFFSIIAHDLRSPFTSILGFSKLLLKKNKNYSVEKRENFISLIHTSTEKTYQLLNNLLTWARIQSGKIEYVPEKFNLKKLIHETIDVFEESAKKKEINLFDLVEDNEIIFADKNMINTVLRNLISNAIKFTNRKGKIIITTEKSDKNDSEKILVSDTGVGLLDQQIANLFGIDNNIATEGTEKESGTGLGLVLCKEFVEIHNGTIGVENNKEQGATFWFTIPNNHN